MRKKYIFLYEKDPIKSYMLLLLCMPTKSSSFRLPAFSCESFEACKINFLGQPQEIQTQSHKTENVMIMSAPTVLSGIYFYVNGGCDEHS